MNNIKLIEPKVSETIERIKKKLVVAFEIVNLGSISFYLGLKVKQNREK